MKVSVILAHPDPESFNHGIAYAVLDILKKTGNYVYFHDLYRENFSPVLSRNEIPDTAEIPVDIQNYCMEISESDGIVIVHPNWWGQPPAVLKGWIDRVMRPGIAHIFEEGDSGEGIPVGLLKAKTALIFNTSNTPDKREY